MDLTSAAPRPAIVVASKRRPAVAAAQGDSQKAPAAKKAKATGKRRTATQASGEKDATAKGKGKPTKRAAARVKVARGEKSARGVQVAAAAAAGGRAAKATGGSAALVDADSQKTKRGADDGRRQHGVSELRRKRHKQTEDVRRHRINTAIDDVRRMLGIDPRVDKASVLDRVKALLAERALGVNGSAGQGAAGEARGSGCSSARGCSADGVLPIMAAGSAREPSPQLSLSLPQDEPAAWQAAWSCMHLELPRLPQSFIALIDATDDVVVELNGNALAHLGLRRTDLPRPWAAIADPAVRALVPTLDALAHRKPSARRWPAALTICIPLRNVDDDVIWVRLVCTRVSGSDMDVHCGASTAAAAAARDLAASAAAGHISSSGVPAALEPSKGYLLAVGRVLREAPECASVEGVQPLATIDERMSLAEDDDEVGGVAPAPAPA
jgi:hypothetical protein